MRLCLDRAFLSSWRVEQLEPSTDTDEATTAEVCHTLRLGGEPGNTPPEIVMWISPRRASMGAQGAVRVAERAPVDLSAWVWP